MINKSIEYFFIILFIFYRLDAQDKVQVINPYSSLLFEDIYEIDEIVFQGNLTFLKEELSSIIKTRPTNRSLVHNILLYYYTNIEHSEELRRAAPKGVMPYIENVLYNMNDQVTFYKYESIIKDIDIINNYYIQNGFHEIKIRTILKGDTNNGKNILKFIIKENSRYKINFIKYYGLDSLSDEIAKIITRQMKIKCGDYYNEQDLYHEINAINNILLDNGYFYSNYKLPYISYDNITKQDSILIKFTTGKRQRIADVTFIDSTREQSKVVESMKSKQLEFNIGDWYSREKVSRSLDNMLSLGTFDIVNIDTISGKTNKNDTSLHLQIYSQYKIQQEYGISPSINQTSFDKSVNLGIELFYTHKNIFGAAQVFNPYARFLLIDINRGLSDWSKKEYEFQIGINFAQPLLFTWDEMRVGLSFQALYAIRTINQTLKINSVGLPLKFPAKLPFWTFYRMLNFDFSIEWQAPMNFADALEKAHELDKNIVDSFRTEESFRIYGNLDRYVKEYHPWLTTSTIGASIVGDTRDNAFAPTRGYFASISIDCMNFLLYPFELVSKAFNQENKIMGLAKYIRFQVTNYWFWTISENSVFALKQKEGYMYWWNKLNAYIPFDKQFFAGGANSVRAWPSRQLRYGYDYYNTNNDGYNSFASDFIGSSSLIEGSMEYRYSIGKYDRYNTSWQNFLSGFGITGFIDWGNTFEWLVVDKEGNIVIKNKWYEYITNLAVAIGIGLRYDTPVGPLRFDFAWPLYDPARSKDQTLFTRNNSFSTMYFNIGIGHAF